MSISRILGTLSLVILAIACAKSDFPTSQSNGNQPLSRDQRRARYLGDNFDFVSEIRGRSRIASIDDLFGTPGSYKLHDVIGVFRKFTHPGDSRDFDHYGFVYLHANVPNLNSTTAGQFDFGSLPNPNIADYQNPATRMNTATRATPAFLMQPSNFVSQYFPYIIGKNSDGTYYNSGKIKFEFNDSGFETYADPANAIHGQNTHNIIVAPTRPEYDYLGLTALQSSLPDGSQDNVYWSYVYRISSTEIEVRFEKQYLSVEGHDDVQVDTYIIAKYTFQP